jgi:signal transduction histidine kinase
LNYSPIELKGKSISQVFGKIEFTAVSDLIHDKNDNHLPKQISLIDRGGKHHQVFITAIPMVGEHSQRTMLLLQDVTETTRYSDVISRLEKQSALGETIAEFAHDARNYINRLSTGIQLLEKKSNPSADEANDYNNLLEDCDNLSDMMESVLSYSRQDTQQYESIDLAGFIQKVIYRNRYKADKAGVHLQFNNRFPGALILGDQRSLERVVLNLINNAIDATKHQGGTVSITQLLNQQDPHQVIIKIADNGPGIPDNLSEVLLANQYSDKPSGTGLGLLISRKIIESHQGQIKLDSFAGGTIFSIFLPLHTQGEIN